MPAMNNDLSRAFPAATLRGLWTYRDFVLGSVRREFQSKYSNAVLGASWSLLSPLAMIVVYTVIFSQVMHARLPGAGAGVGVGTAADAPYAYSIWLCAGILSWNLFAAIVARAQGMFIEQASLIRKISFPRICLPVIVVLGALLDFGIMFGLFTLFLLGSGNFPGWVFAALAPLLLLQVLLAIGLGTVAGVLNVFFRDVGPFVGIAMQFWFWLTPIVYPASILPVGVRALLLDWNPMARLVGAWQGVLVTGTAPDWAGLASVALLAVLLCLLALHLFRRHAGEMADEL
jgi:lipopolysaccharide transport system permease protein